MRHFRLVNLVGQVYTPNWVLLDFSAQPLMLGKATCISLGIQRPELKSCSFQIQTSLGGANDRSHFMTRERFSMQMKPEHATYNYNITTLALGSRPRQGVARLWAKKEA